jgi:sulfite reductase alpha subunit-like flavoprotein
MKKALIIHQSKKGHTRRYGEEIGKFLAEKGIESRVISLEDYSTDLLQDVSHLFLGCWTSGLFLFAQHPDKAWIHTVQKMTLPEGIQIGLFTTYVLATGSMFRAMKKHIPGKSDIAMPEWKSKNCLLSDLDKETITRFITG